MKRLLPISRRKAKVAVVWLTVFRPLVRKVRRGAEAIAQAIARRVRLGADTRRGVPDSAAPPRRRALPAVRDTGARATRAVRRALTH
jgi:hypothetical protein